MTEPLHMTVGYSKLLVRFYKILTFPYILNHCATFFRQFYSNLSKNESDTSLKVTHDKILLSRIEIQVLYSSMKSCVQKDSRNIFQKEKTSSVQNISADEEEVYRYLCIRRSHNKRRRILNIKSNLEPLH